MGGVYFDSLSHQTLVQVACRLHETAVELWEQVNQNSQNSSRPPSSDDPFRKGKEKEKGSDKASGENASDENNDEDNNTASDEKKKSKSRPKDAGSVTGQNRSAGKQPGAPGTWQSEPLKAEQIIPHYPDHCAVCGRELSVYNSSKPHTGHYVLELERKNSGFRVVCSLHHYYSAGCECGHETRERPGEGYASFNTGYIALSRTRLGRNRSHPPFFS